uniref:Uncharacterized protein n=2 Tax=Nothobranchius korthausae TaxID=1143690 RepID=A0A1A8FE52_9TELE
MKLTAAFLALSMVVLMAQPSEGFLGLLFGAIPHIIKGISSLAGGGVEERAVQQEVDQDLQQEQDQLDLDLQQLEQDLQQKLDQLEQKKLNQKKLIKLLHK